MVISTGTGGGGGAVTVQPWKDVWTYVELHHTAAPDTLLRDQEEQQDDSRVERVDWSVELHKRADCRDVPRTHARAAVSA